MSCSVIDPIKDLLRQGDVERARECLLDSLHSSAALRVWHRCLRVPDARSMPRILSFVRDVEFVDSCETAQVELETGRVSLGPSFVLTMVDSFEDLLFVILHERGHVLFNEVYGTRLGEFKNFDFGNAWEDVYINNSVMLIMKSNLPSRYYSDEEGFFRFLCLQQTDRWFDLFSSWLRFHLPIPEYQELSVLSESPFFTKTLSYPRWMALGLLIEEKLGKGKIKPEPPPPLLGLGPPLGGEFPGGKKGILRSAMEAADDITVAQGGPSRRGMSGDGVQGTPAPIIPVLPESLQIALRSLAPQHQPAGVSDLTNALDLGLKIREFVQVELAGGILAQKQNDATFEGTTACPEGLHARDLFNVAAGYPPSIWTVEYSVSEEKLKLYIDVSGSMADYWCFVASIAEQFGEYCDEYFQFSNDVVAVDPRERHIFSTGGTDYGVVAEHILQQGYKEVIVVTDNTDGIEEEARDALRLQLDALYLVQTRTDPGVRRGFDAIATQTLDLFEVDIEDLLL